MNNVVNIDAVKTPGAKAVDALVEEFGQLRDFAEAAARGEIDLSKHENPEIKALSAELKKLEAQAIEVGRLRATPDPALVEMKSRVAELRKFLDTASIDESKPRSMRLSSQVGAEFLKDLELRAQGEVRYVLSGFKSLNRAFPGFLSQGRLVILAGRPAMGKSALAQQIAEHVAEYQDKTVIYITLEMPCHDIYTRSISRRSGVSSDDLTIAVNLTDAQLSDISKAMDEVNNINLIIDEKSADIEGLVRKITAEASTLEARGMPPLGLVVIDYLQLVICNGVNRNVEIGQVSIGLKNMAKDLAVPVLALSQLSRAVENRVDKRPNLSDLRESGNIEQDADLVMFVYRDEYYFEDSPEPGIAEILVEKNRHGKTGMEKLRFIGNRVMFEDLLGGSDE